MDSSRIFIRGLPPQMTADDFRRHFSKQFGITDARLIPHRRIGYVGYKTPEEAMRAVKYHNKSFIKMSRVQVELARSVDQENALKLRRQSIKKPQGNMQIPTGQPLQNQELSLKRKRGNGLQSEDDPKLQEYLGVMQPASRSRTWANEEPAGIKPRKQDNAVNGKDETGSVIHINDETSYQEVRQKKKKSRRDSKETSPRPTEVSPATLPAELVVSVPDVDDTSTMNISEIPPATDDDWLRSRTSRLLGLVEDDDSAAPEVAVDGVEPQKDMAPGSGGERSRSGFINTSLHLDDAVASTSAEVAPVSNITKDVDRATNRLFVRNLPYTATEDDIRQHVEQVGIGGPEEIHVPIDYQSGNIKGFAYLQYSDAEAATKALQELDGRTFQGRLLHVIYSSAKRQSGLDEVAIAKLPLKKQQQIKRKAEAASTTFNWNSMYMNADAVMSSVADRLGVPKSELLDPTSADAALKQAHAETHIIQETKSYFSANGVDLDAFKRKERGDTAFLVKNFSYGTKADELQKMFEAYGTVQRLLMPPSGTIAIVEFLQADHARTAFRSLAYRKFKESVLFIEKAPRDLFSAANDTLSSKAVNSDRVRGAKQSATDLLNGKELQPSIDTSTLFVRNLNFSTTSERLREVFKPLDGYMSARVKTKPDPKHAGQVLSMGFGFLEFGTKEQAQAALAAMDGHSLDGHELLIRASHKGADAAEERRREDNAKKIARKRTKIIIKNLPFEASKKDVRSLLSSYGQLRSVRVPKKFDSSTRGFAFADFVTAREAENAMDALKDTHLLGRRLVLDFAAGDEIDPEQEIAKMQQKAGKQADKVALQRLTGSGRKKFNLEGNEDIDRG
ncbi:MAG: hypothetical protein LQ343_005979 [Gyalolechia ehrenbergii]|nr:MAG: hypothetical protein LQ343_005979 [Gyalolechia ehrenbergii]